MDSSYMLPEDVDKDSAAGYLPSRRVGHSDLCAVLHLLPFPSAVWTQLNPPAKTQPSILGRGHAAQGLPPPTCLHPSLLTAAGRSCSMGLLALASSHTKKWRQM
ncbi:hypothetical protein Y1Q_0006268 [Alligator mississippiensis]|uniref:Uncharacterized protein n=1 Tax=Alligator mississippiensis TaxID=8496 RepID=A0A151NXF8_ALLMI|nr:hypothetical protein Y1Q_0006268 [Alligator mississippiensis]